MLLLLLLLSWQNAGSNTISCDNQEGAARNGRSTALAPLTDTGSCIDRGLVSISTSRPALGPAMADPKCQLAVWGGSVYDLILFSFFWREKNGKDRPALIITEPNGLDYPLLCFCLQNSNRKPLAEASQARSSSAHSGRPGCCSLEQLSVTLREFQFGVLKKFRVGASAVVCPGSSQLQCETCDRSVVEASQPHGR